MTKIEAFKKKYGNRTLGMVVGIFVKNAAPFKDDEKLSAELGTIIAELESALEEVRLPNEREYERHEIDDYY